jgi:hypothetical protein
MSNPYGHQRWQGLVEYMLKEDWSHKIPMLLDFIDTTDAQRGTNFRNIFPELKNL